MTAAATPRDPARKPHRVTRLHALREGTDAVRALFLAFDWFNTVLFGGTLATPSITVGPCASPRAAGDYQPRNASGLESSFRIAPATIRRGLRFTLGTLLHEMVHAWQHEVAHDSEPGHKHHGPKFSAEANRIGELLGFPAVAYRGRGDALPAEHWPPHGRFDDDPAEPARGDRAPVAAADAAAPWFDEPTAADAPAAPPPDVAALVAAAVAEERQAAADLLRLDAGVLVSEGRRKGADLLRTYSDLIERGHHRADQGEREPS